MPTENRRVATYLPKELDELFLAFKQDRGLNGDSPALIAILSEFFGVSQSVIHQSEPLVTKQEFEDALHGLRSELLGELSSELKAIESAIQLKISGLESRIEPLQQGDSKSELDGKLLTKIDLLDQRLSILESNSLKDATLATNDLAKRLNMSPSTLSHWKSSDPKRGKSPDELLQATREKDPDGVGWILVPELNRFKPERDLPLSKNGGSGNVLQGELLHAESSNQVNPLPEGSERSEEG